MRKFTKEDKRKEAFIRAANVFFSYWRVLNQNERDSGANRIHSRLLEYLIEDEFIKVGESVEGKGHREHIVPLAMIRDQAIIMFNQNYLVEDVAEMIEKNLKIVYITKTEQQYLDNELGYKTTMPEGWKFGDNPFARLNKGNIKIKFYK